MQPLNNKYDALIENQNNEVSIIDHYTSIIDLKKSSAKINLLISLEETQQNERQQLRGMKDNIDIALKEQIAILRQKQKKTGAYPLSDELLTAQDIGKLAKCFIVSQKKWKNSVVEEIDVEEQTAKIKKYGKNQILELPAYYLKVLKELDADLFKQGTHCKAIYSGDGEFYPCIIEKVLEQGYLVKYKKYNSQQIVKLHRLRPMAATQEKKEEVKFQKDDEFVVPDKLKIMPNDPQNVKKSKKTKIKALKFAFKNSQIQEINKEKQQKWKEWNHGSTTASQKVGHFKTKYDMQIINQKK